MEESPAATKFLCWWSDAVFLSYYGVTTLLVIISPASHDTVNTHPPVKHLNWKDNFNKETFSSKVV